MDDASRSITSDEILTDYEMQFVESREKAKYKFKDFLAENGVKPIVARINHPQTNGKKTER
mgnify:CR=1 FL=1